MRWLALPMLLVLAACGQQPAAKNEPEVAEAKPYSGEVALTPDQISTAGIEIVSPTIVGSGGAIELPATIDSDLDAIRVVAAPIEGRIVALTRNIGDYIRRGDRLASLESREGANLQGEVEKACTTLNLARVTLDRDEALYAKGFRPKREVDISRAAYEQAQTGLRMARQQVAASGISGNSINRIVLTSPIAGRVIVRNAVLGQMFTSNATKTELFRIADTGHLSVNLSLSPTNAARVSVGSVIDVTAPGRRGTGLVSFISPALDL